MAQFDLYANPSHRSREWYPYLVDVQHRILSGLKTRVVIPLRPGQAGAVEHLEPEVIVGANSFTLCTGEISGIARKVLAAPLGNLVDQREVILKALNFLTGGF